MRMGVKTKEKGAIKMKKVISLTLALVLVIAMTGCGQSKTLSADELANKLANEIRFESEMNVVDAEVFSTMYPIKSEDVVFQKTYISTGYTAEEISVVECSTIEAAGRVKKAFETRVAYQMQSFQNFMPDELTKLQNAVIEIQGKNVILCISNETDKAKKILISK